MSHGHGHGHAAGEGASEQSVAAGYEVADTKVRPLIITTIAIFVVIFLSYVLMAGLLFIAGNAPGDTSNAMNPTDIAIQLPPEPRLEQNPEVDGNRLVAEATERLEGYGWVAQRDGIAHIPVERSMELLLEKGVNPFGEGQ
jgi:hypothetical protein